MAMTISEQGNVPHYLTVKDIQQVFRCGRDKAYRIVNTEGFPKMTLYGTILVHPDALNKWMSRHHNSEIY